MQIADLAGHAPVYEAHGFRFFEHPEYGEDAAMVVVTPSGKLIEDSDVHDIETAADAVEQGWFPRA